MFVSGNDHLFLALDKITEQLDKLYNTHFTGCIIFFQVVRLACFYKITLEIEKAYR